MIWTAAYQHVSCLCLWQILACVLTVNLVASLIHYKDSQDLTAWLPSKLCNDVGVDHQPLADDLLFL